MSASGIESSSVASHALFFTNQIEVTFADDIGNHKNIRGTGFWVEKEGSQYFVTNAHNIDPRMKLGPDTKMCLRELMIILRTKNGDIWLSETGSFEVEIDGLKKHTSADVAVIKKPKFINKQHRFQYGCFSYGDIADESFFLKHLNVMDNASFIGFPGKKGLPWCCRNMTRWSRKASEYWPPRGGYLLGRPQGGDGSTLSRGKR